MQHRSLDKYARLMQKLEIVTVEFFKVLLLPLDVIYLQLDISFCLVTCFHVLFILFLNKWFPQQGFCQLFGIFFHFVFETFGHQSIHPSGKAVTDTLSRKYLYSFTSSNTLKRNYL